jgi:hypothetical protein
MMFNAQCHRLQAKGLLLDAELPPFFATRSCPASSGMPTRVNQRVCILFEEFYP